MGFGSFATFDPFSNLLYYGFSASRTYPGVVVAIHIQQRNNVPVEIVKVVTVRIAVIRRYGRRAANDFMNEETTHGGRDPFTRVDSTINRHRGFLFRGLLCYILELNKKIICVS